MVSSPPHSVDTKSYHTFFFSIRNIILLIFLTLLLDCNILSWKQCNRRTYNLEYLKWSHSKDKPQNDNCTIFSSHCSTSPFGSLKSSFNSLAQWNKSVIHTCKVKWWLVLFKQRIEYSVSRGCGSIEPTQRLWRRYSFSLLFEKL